ncbi:FtsH protease activity modulator HflK [Salinispirillum marinum]|uniref:Protein HflK n=2 Tax=Saccharospirillaceae TaxID=255527 RepID=A0ABV8BIZ8_9GAMM
MAWNEPPDNQRNDQDPWGRRQNGKQDGPPDLDQLIGDWTKKINQWLSGNKRGGNQGGNQGGSGGGQPGSAKGLWLAAVVVLLGAGLYNAFYTLDEQERGVVLRFGNFYKMEMPGLRFKLPLIDQVEKVNVTNLRSYAYQGLMLTEDDNIVDVSMTVQYLASDARAFALNVRSPERSLEDAANAALRHEVGSLAMDQVLTAGRTALADGVRQRLQSYIDEYGSGITISAVNIREAQAPNPVRDAFDDVIRAREDEQRVINQAQAYANQVIPEARGAAQRQLEEAAAYRAQLVSTAEGDAARFLSLYNEYAQAPEVTRERLYLETLSAIYGDANKVLLDVREGSNNMMYLPLDRIAGGNAGAAGLTDTDLRRITDELERRIRQNPTRN